MKSAVQYKQNGFPAYNRMKVAIQRLNSYESSRNSGDVDEKKKRMEKLYL